MSQSTASGDTGRVFDPHSAFRAILDYSPLHIVIFDRDLVVREASRAAIEHAGMSREELLGQTLRADVAELLGGAVDSALSGSPAVIERQMPLGVGDRETWMRMTLLPIPGTDGTVWGMALVGHDVSPQKQAEELVEKLAFVDPVTELPNRTMLSMALSRALSGAKAKQRQLALVWLNLDRFKDVNDALGQQAGDLLLHAVGERLQDSVRTNDMVARVGGDDFAVLLPRINSRRHLDRLLDRVRDAFAVPFVAQPEPVLLTASYGVAVHPNGGCEARELWEHAHTAMRTAKELGGGGYELDDSGLCEDVGRRLRLGGEIRDGIEKSQFAPHYQPQIDLSTMQVQAVEALARWSHPERGLVPPVEFIPYAEESGLIAPLGRHLLAQACAHLQAWHATLAAPPRLAINVSAREFQRADVCGDVRRAVEHVGLPPSCIEVEITETAVLANPVRSAEVAACLRDAGATVALDDFGTGFSSLTHLRELPIDCVKIDRSFVSRCLEDSSSAAILVAVTLLAHDLGLRVVAEGVETQAQLDFVRSIGCDAAQGYFLARPLPFDDCTEYLLHPLGTPDAEAQYA